VAQVQAQNVSLMSALKSGLQNITEADISIANGTLTAVTNFAACINNLPVLGTALLTLNNPITSCATKAANDALNVIQNGVKAKLQVTTQLFNQLLGIGVTTATQVANTTIQSVEQTVQSYASQINNITQQTLVCLSASTTTATANATATR